MDSRPACPVAKNHFSIKTTRKRQSNGHWQSHRDYGHGRPAPQNTKPVELVKSPITASATAVEKLGAIVGKENLPNAVSLSPTRGKACTRMDIVAGPEVQSCLPPSTPAVRLPLSDLLGNYEEKAHETLRKEDSPEEQLAWRAAGGYGKNENASSHRRKRAHSSSPTTSSQADTSVRSVPRKHLDFDQVHRILRTPRADPATDLWSRYHGLSMNEEPGGNQLPSLAHLLNEASPQSIQRTPGGSVGGLRRWASCGTEWPESKAKRRKTRAITGQHKVSVNDEMVEAIDSTNLGAIVDQLQARLSRPKRELSTEAPSSSSPLPDKSGFDGLLKPSPPNDVADCVHGKQSLIVDNLDGDAPNKDVRIKQSQSSDYGDEIVDLTELTVDEVLDDYVLPVNRPGRPDGVHDSGHRDDTTIDDCTNASDHNKSAVSNHLMTIQEEADEFGDDDDLTAEDLELALTQAECASFPKKSERFLLPHSHNEPRCTHAAQQDSEQPRQAAFTDTFSSDEDEFGELDVDDEQFAAAEIAATQAYRASAPSQGSKPIFKSRSIQRYQVKQVIAGKYLNERGFEQEEKVVLVEDEKSKSVRAITLRQSWLDTHCTPGAYVHVVGQFSHNGQITIDDAANLLILHPDHLVSATAVADSFDCLRKAVLQDRVKATNVTSKATVYGTILHELFQIALQKNRWDVDWLHQQLVQLVVKYIEGLFEAGAQDTNEALEFLTAKMPELRDWASHFVRGTPGNEAKAQDRNGKTVNLSITKLLDVEEHVWSPMYGLKGNIDATVEIAMEDEGGERHLTVPLELKTGKYQSAAHRAQTALYTLLLSDRYDVEVQYGVLFYMENSAVSRIPAVRNELRHMVMQRNELASYVRERLSLPAMLKNEFKCGRCYAKTSCFLYHKLSEDGSPETAGVGAKFSQVVAKLKPADQDFFKKWDELLTKEETEMFKFRRELWTMLSHEREKLGRCFAEVIIEPGTCYENSDGQKINRFAYSFVKRSASPAFSFTESQITVGEPIVISSEQGHFALANGYVTKVSAHRIGVAVDRRLHNTRIRQPGFDEVSNQSFAALMEVDMRAKAAHSRRHDLDEQTIFRLDKDEFSNGMATVRNNLLAIMDDDVFRSHELRDLIIQNRPPIFRPAPTAYTLSGPASQMQINPDQRAAIDKIMSAQDYALVLGMPGTGKTTTIAHIIRALVARGKSVLLTSYTHTAVDNILLKLRDSSVSVLRLGVTAKIHPDVQEFAKLAALPRGSIQELEEMYMTPQVVATTCLGINHQIFQKRLFDYCIVDEASQITLPVCLGPIRMARTFVLVGDHYQLPPLVQNAEAREGGLDESLFRLLSNKQPSSVANLEHQYRMCADIMHLSNTLVYGGRLKCGSQAVADYTLDLPNENGLSRFHDLKSDHVQTSPGKHPGRCISPSSPECQLGMLLDRSRKVTFANTDNIGMMLETLVGSRIVNQYEASVLRLVSTALVAQGILPDQIGIITFYRSQLSLLRQSLKGTSAATTEMHTADKFQGRDKDVVLLSCARSNKDSNVGDLLRDWRRVNVAITRARSKFIIVGSRKTLMGDELWKKLICLVDDMGGIVDLKDDFLSGHDFDDFTGSDLVERVTQRTSPIERKAKVLGTSAGAANRRPMRAPVKQGKIGKDLLLKKRPVSQDVINMILQ
ncbi:hypothetical protein ANO11243_015530 [Dothideomycetidae sp. 11243]|nr:hypothetical protein ANO11243_015530 [fungal sp. No.11243]